jgi:hypothetical protein
MMGIEYRHYVMPKDRGFAPTRAQLNELIEALRAERWAHGQPQEESAGGDIQIVLPVERWGGSGLRYPFASRRAPDPEAYYEIQIHLAAQYVHHASEIIDPLAATSCACGGHLEFEPLEDLFYASRLHLACPGCGEPFDPSALATTIRDPWTGEESTLLGGAAYRFALVIDCGKSLPEADGAFRLEPALPQLLSARLGRQFVDTRDLY